MTHSEELNELAAALCAAQAEFTAIPKDSTNPFFKSRYAGLPQVVEVASPILTKHGLAVSQFIGADETGDTLTTWLMHESGQFIAQPMRLHLVSKSDRDGNALPPDSQAQGSATTYARRYSYMSVLGLVADEDDDGNKASQNATRAGSARQRVSAGATNPAVPADNGSVYVNQEDISAIKNAAKGLTVRQIKLALGSIGASFPESGELFSMVPRDKATHLAKVLAGTARETA